MGPHFFKAYKQCSSESDMLIQMISNVLEGNCLDYNPTQTHLEAQWPEVWLSILEHRSLELLTLSHYSFRPL